MLDLLQQLLPEHVGDNHVKSTNFFVKLFDHLGNFSLPLHWDHVQVTFIHHKQIATGVAPGRLPLLLITKKVSVKKSSWYDGSKHLGMCPIVLRKSGFMHPLSMLHCHSNHPLGIIEANPPDHCQVLGIHSIQPTSRDTRHHDLFNIIIIQLLDQVIFLTGCCCVTLRFISFG